MGSVTETRKNVATAARGWLGTPYHYHGRLQGVGVDCAMLLAEVYEGLGLVGHVEPGHYAQDWHMHHSEELFVGWIEKLGAVQVAAPQLGDIAVFRFGRTFSHGAICVETGVDPLYVHAYFKRSVILTRESEEPLAGRERRYYTLFKE